MSSRVAILSDVIMKFGGAERVLESFLTIYPNADLYTLFVVPSARNYINKKFPDVIIRTSVWQKLIVGDVVSKYIAIIKIWSWLYWETLNLEEYNIVISSSHSFMSKNVKTTSNCFHLSYVHTPPRYLYGVFNEISLINRWPVSWFFGPIKWLLRKIDVIGARRPDLLVANSKNVAKRILSYYKRKAEVVYPPVDVSLVSGYYSQTSDYYVWVSRLVRQKGADLAIRACQKMGRKLIVIGDGDERRWLESISDPTITFVGGCSDEEKTKIMSRARGLIYTSVDEDFGIVPVEALKLGIGVVAYDSGGVREVVDDGIEGVLYTDYSVDGLVEGLRKFEKTKISKFACRRKGNKFGKKIFEDKIRELIKNGHDRKNK